MGGKNEEINVFLRCFAFHGEFPVRDDLPREMLAEHCCNVIHLVFSWSILQGELVDQETGMQSLYVRFTKAVMRQ